MLLCHDAYMPDPEESYASQFARKGGLARAKKLTPKERSESARKAVEVRWAKQKALVMEITNGTKALLRVTKKRQAAIRKRGELRGMK
jgi:hypothetical protein